MQSTVSSSPDAANGLDKELQGRPGAADALSASQFAGIEAALLLAQPLWRKESETSTNQQKYQDFEEI